MTISSRTPEGLPQRCPICGEAAAVDPSFPAGDACCPACGNLLWWFRDRLRETAPLAADDIDFGSSFASTGVDSLDMVELVMELEEKFDINISDEDAAQIQTIEDAIRYIRRHRADDAA